MCGTEKEPYSVKSCTKCGGLKPTSEYYAKKTGKDGLHSWCKECIKEYKKKWWDENKDEQSERISKWKKENPEKIRCYRKKWRDNNPEKQKEASNTWVKNNPEKHREKEKRAYEKRRKKEGERLQDAVRSGFVRGILRGSKASRKTFEILGYTVEQLRIHIENQLEPGMTWENYGRGGWEIDHIIPLAAHNYETPDDMDFKRAWSLGNLRPMWGPQNKSKSDKLSKPFQPSLLISVNDTTTPPLRKESHGKSREKI